MSYAFLDEFSEIIDFGLSVLSLLLKNWNKELSDYLILDLDVYIVS